MYIQESYFIFINIVICLLLIFAAYKGYKNGFIYELFSLIAGIVILTISFIFAPLLASNYRLFKLDDQLILRILGFENLINTIIWFLIIFISGIIIFFFIKKIFKIFNNIIIIGKVNRFLGLFFGLVKMIFIITIISGSSLVLISNGDEIKEKTMIHYVHNYADKIGTYFKNNFSDIPLNKINDFLKNTKNLEYVKYFFNVKGIHDEASFENNTGINASEFKDKTGIDLETFITMVKNS